MDPVNTPSLDQLTRYFKGKDNARDVESEVKMIECLRRAIIAGEETPSPKVVKFLKKVVTKVSRGRINFPTPLEQGEAIYSACIRKATPTQLLFAARWGYLDLMKEIDEMGPRETKSDNCRDKVAHATPLHYSAMHGYDEMTEYLCGRHRDTVDRVTSDKHHTQTPLHFAAKFGRLRSAKALLDHGAEVNFQDSLKSTPLHLALAKRCYKAALFLFFKGADPSLKDQFERTPLDNLKLVSEGTIQAKSQFQSIMSTQFSLPDPSACQPKNTPRDIWLKIFSHLSRRELFTKTRLTCRHFNQWIILDLINQMWDQSYKTIPAKHLPNRVTEISPR